MEIEYVRANGFEFRCRSAGAAGEPVILLHGFPESGGSRTSRRSSVISDALQLS